MTRYLHQATRWFLATIFLVSFAASSFAQIYPVRVQTFIAPPYPRTLETFANKGTNRTRLYITLTDKSKTSYDVYLRLVIEGPGLRMESAETSWIKVSLSSSHNTEIDNDAISDLFRPKNLTGYDYAAQAEGLPEGLYKIKFEAYDVNRKILVSNPNVGYQIAWITKFEPPYVNLPISGQAVDPAYGQSVIFQWSPRCVIPASSSVHYTLRIVKMDSASVSPDATFSQPKEEWTFDDLTTTNLQVNSVISGTNFQVNYWYAFKVRIVDETGLLQFRNDGWSAASKFFYGSPCDAPDGLTIRDGGDGTATLNWIEMYGSQYELQYREKGKLFAPWQIETNISDNFQVKGLSAGKTYEFRLRANCSGLYSDFTPTQTITCAGTDMLSCAPPSRFVAKVVTVNSSQMLQVSWSDVASADKFFVTVTMPSGAVFQKTSFVDSCLFTYGKGGITGDNFTVRIDAVCGGTTKTGDTTSVTLEDGVYAGGDCSAPEEESITTEGYKNGVTKLNWQHDIIYKSYTLLWRPLGSGASYVPVYVTRPPAQVEGCVAWQEYQYQIAYHCTNGDTDSGQVHVFIGDTTDLDDATGTGTCYAPIGLRGFVPDSVHLQVVWLKENSVSEYQVQYKLHDSTEFVETRSTRQTELKFSVKEDETYDIRVRSVCSGAGGYSLWSDVVTVSTADTSTRAGSCPVPEHEEPGYVNGVEVFVNPILKSSKQTGVTAQLREFGSTVWTDYAATNKLVSFKNLKEFSVYEYRIAAYCRDLMSDFCVADTFKTFSAQKEKSASDTSKCGQTESITSPGGALSVINVKDSITAAKWKLRVGAVSTAAEGNGYDGKATAKVSFFKGAQANFNLISCTFNENKEMTNGVANMTSFKISIIDAALASKINQALNYVDQGIDYIDQVKDLVKQGTDIIDGLGTSTTTPDSASMAATYGSLTAQQKLDKAYQLIKEGASSVTSADLSAGGTTLKEALWLLGQAIAGGVKDLLTGASSPELLAHAVQFRPLATQANGLDYFRYRPNVKQFNNIDFTDGTYYVPVKSLEEGKTDRARVILPPGKKPHGTTLASGEAAVYFLDQDKNECLISDVNTNKDGYTTATITIPATAKRVKAVEKRLVDSLTVDILLGRLDVETYTPATRIVLLVPVNGKTLPVTTQTVEDSLNRFYRQAAMTWKVSLRTNGVNISGWDTHLLDDGDNAMMSKYTTDMQTLIQAYKDSYGDPGADTSLLFICGSPASGSKQGYMPIKGRFGFLFADKLTAANAPRTAAHELGHGAFRLWHTFSTQNKYLFAQATTPNLMDYNNDSTELFKYQWDYIHDPESIAFAWSQDEAEGAMSSPLFCDRMLNFLKDIREINIHNPNGAYTQLSKYFIDEDFFAGKRCALQLTQPIIVVTQNTLTTTPVSATVIDEDGNEETTSPTVEEWTTSETINKTQTINVNVSIHSCQNDNLSTKDVQAILYSIQSRKIDVKRNNNKITYVFFTGSSNQSNHIDIEIDDKDDLFFRTYLNVLDKQDVCVVPKISSSQNILGDIEPIIPVEDFIYQDGKDCYKTCLAIMKKYNSNYGGSWNMWALATRNESDEVCVHKECYALALNVLNELLDKGIPVIVGVDWKEPRYNFDCITDHWTIIVGRGSKDNRQFYTYYEVAGNESTNGKGTNTKYNRFVLNDQGFLEAINPTVNSKGNKPIVTAIRIEPENCCCDRTNYSECKNPTSEHKSKDKCGTFYNHISSPKGTLIIMR